MRKKYYLYSGLVAVVIEWVGLLLIVTYLHRLDPDKALSTNTVAPWPVPIIFGLTLTLAGVGYALFSLALRSYSRYLPYVGVAAGTAFAVTGWTPYTGNGGPQDILHQVFSYLALIGYVIMIWLLRAHPRRQISLVSQIIVGLIFAIILLSLISNYLGNPYFAYLQIAIVGLVQAWTVLVVWHERRPSEMDKKL